VGIVTVAFLADLALLEFVHVDAAVQADSHALASLPTAARGTQLGGCVQALHWLGNALPLCRGLLLLVREGGLELRLNRGESRRKAAPNLFALAPRLGHHLFYLSVSLTLHRSTLLGRSGAEFSSLCVHPRTQGSKFGQSYGIVLALGVREHDELQRRGWPFRRKCARHNREAAGQPAFSRKIVLFSLCCHETSTHTHGHGPGEVLPACCGNS